MSEPNIVSPLRQRMIEDMTARKLTLHTQRSHLQSCRRFATWLKRSLDTATPDDVRQFQLYLIESGTSICNRNRIMTGVRFLFRVTLRRHDLAAEVWHIREEGLRPHIITDNLDLAPNLSMGVIGHANGARFGDAFKAGGNVDAIPEDVVVVDDDVADVDADAKFDPLILRHGQRSARPCRAGLQRHRVPHPPHWQTRRAFRRPWS